MPRIGKVGLGCIGRLGFYKCPELLDWHGPTEQVPLQFVAPGCAQDIGLLFGFNALCDHAHVKA